MSFAKEKRRSCPTLIAGIMADPEAKTKKDREVFGPGWLCLTAHEADFCAQPSDSRPLASRCRS